MGKIFSGRQIIICLCLLKSTWYKMIYPKILFKYMPVMVLFMFALPKKSKSKFILL